MNKIFTALGSVIMVITGIFATKPAKKFGIPPQVYVGSPYNVVLFVISATSHLTTVKGTYHTLFFKTTNGPAVTCLTSSVPFAHVIYYKP